MHTSKLGTKLNQLILIIIVWLKILTKILNNILEIILKILMRILSGYTDLEGSDLNCFLHHGLAEGSVVPSWVQHF